MPTIKVNDINTYYEIHGEGEPLFLISGLASDLRALEFVVPLLVQKFKVIMFDNRGAGRTDVTEAPYTTSMLADDAVALMDALKISKAHVLGHSMGGAIAQHLALKHPEKIKKLILSSTFAKQPARTKWSVATLVNLLKEKVSLPLIVQINLPWLYGNTFMSDAKKTAFVLDKIINNPYPITALGFENQANACFTHDLDLELSQITAPTLVISGSEDIVAPPEESEKLASKIKNAKQVVLPQVGHIPHIENPLLYVTEILKFLEAV